MHPILYSSARVPLAPTPGRPATPLVRFRCRAARDDIGLPVFFVEDEDAYPHPRPGSRSCAIRRCWGRPGQFFFWLHRRVRPRIVIPPDAPDIWATPGLYDNRFPRHYPDWPAVIDAAVDWLAGRVPNTGNGHGV